MLSGVHESVFVLYVVAPHLSFLIRAVLIIFSFRFFKKGSCQLLAKVCARSTG